MDRDLKISVVYLIYIFTFEVFVSVYLKWIFLAAVDEFCIF